MGLRGYPPNMERREKIAKLRASGMTLREIGEEFDPPMTYQHVQQILKAIEADRKSACIGSSTEV